MLIVAALGGNALLRRGEAPEAATQRTRISEAAAALAPLARDHRLIVTHGNGPQVGMLALDTLCGSGHAPFPLDVLDAESEGMIGYVIEQELAALLPGGEIATLLTQVEVDPNDPAFDRPDKPIGPVVAKAEADRLAAGLGWSMGPDGDGFRRLVPSPYPQTIREIAVIRRLSDAGVIVICAGGGGIPVVQCDDGAIRGVEAVIDKDRSAALLARSLGADALLVLTDVDGVYADWNTPSQRLIRAASPDGLDEYDFPPGTMGPKVEAACRFVRETGGLAGIGALADAAAILDGTAGTTIRADGPAVLLT